MKKHPCLIIALILICAAFSELAVAKTNTSTALSSSANPSTYASSVTFTATVTPSSATGTVTFKDGTTTLGTGTLSSGKATFSTSTLKAGSHSITAAYGGDTNYNTSTSSPLTQTVNKASSTTALSSSANPSTYGSSVKFTATVTPSACTGTVTFLDGKLDIRNWHSQQRQGDLQHIKLDRRIALDYRILPRRHELQQQHFVCHFANGE